MEAHLISLRRKWLEYPELRQDIEEEARILLGQMAQVRASIPLSLAELEKTMQPGAAEAMVEALILGLVEFLNIGKNMSPAQIRETAAMLAASHSHLTLEHFAMVIHRAKQGQWGQIYDRLDGVVIAGWLEKYTEELRETVQLRRANEHMALKQSRAGDATIRKLRDISSDTNQPLQ